MADLEQYLANKVPALKAYNALATPSPAQQTAIIKELVQAVAALIFIRQNHPDDTP
jgi:hypothetical protein